MEDHRAGDSRRSTRGAGGLTRVDPDVSGVLPPVRLDGGSASVNEAYQGNLFSQQRVASYTKLATGEDVLQDAIESRGLDLTPSDLGGRVKATAVPDTVLFDISVLDAKPELARDLADAIAAQLVVKIEGLEAPAAGVEPVARATVVEAAKTPRAP